MQKFPNFYIHFMWPAAAPAARPLATSQRVSIDHNIMHLLPLPIRASPPAAPANAPGWLGIGWLATIGWLAIGWLAAIDWLATARWQLADLAWLAAN